MNLFRRQPKVIHIHAPREREQALMNSPDLSGEMQGFEEWTLDLTKLSIDEVSDEGRFGTLCKGKYNGEKVTIKLLERPFNNPDLLEAMDKQFKEEVSMLATVDHPNIVRLVGACVKPRVWCIVTDQYTEKGSLSLREFLQTRADRHRPMALKLAIKLALDIAKGVAHLHHHSFVHGCLNPNNLLLGNDNKSIKIADLGVNCHRLMLRNRHYNSKVDVYNFGILLWELVVGSFPFKQVSSLDILNLVAMLPIPSDCPLCLTVIMIRCWAADPNRRPTFQEVIDMLEAIQVEALPSFSCGIWW